MWNGIRPKQNTWKSRSSLLCKVLDVVRAYESVESVNPDVLAKLNVLVVNESDKVVHDVKNENEVKIENVVVNGYHYGHGNDTSTKGA